MRTTLIKTLAIALMVFAFNASPVMANEAPPRDCGYEPSNSGDPSNAGRWICHAQAEGDNKDPGEMENERDFVNSDNEGSTSTASASDQ